MFIAFGNKNVIIHFQHRFQSGLSCSNCTLYSVSRRKCAEQVAVAACRLSLQCSSRDNINSLETIYSCFNVYGLRLEAKAGMNNMTKLQSLCEPRWARCDNAVYTFMSAFRVVVSALEYMEADGDDKARN